MCPPPTIEWRNAKAVWAPPQFKGKSSIDSQQCSGDGRSLWVECRCQEGTQDDHNSEKPVETLPRMNHHSLDYTFFTGTSDSGATFGGKVKYLDVTLLLRDPGHKDGYQTHLDHLAFGRSVTRNSPSYSTVLCAWLVVARALTERSSGPDCGVCVRV